MSFIRLDPQDISISAESVVAPAWSTDDPVLGTGQFVTSSNQVASNTGNYYYDVYNSTPGTAGSEVQFSIAYGNATGGGSALYNSTVPEKSPTSTIYGQYRNLVLGDEEVDFVFGESTVTSIYAINVNRSNYKEKLFPGQFNLTLVLGGNTLELTDNSKIISTVSYVDSGRVFDIISGSDGGTTIGGSNSGLTAGGDTYGKFLPDVGVIILNGDVLDAELGLATETTNLGTENNPGRLYEAIKQGENFELQSEETISSNFIFVRARNAELNYSTNPSYITGSGELRHDVMINSPQSYITTIGLYNDANDLIAVAKLSRPALKDFTTEALFRIKLDY